MADHEPPETSEASTAGATAEQADTAAPVASIAIVPDRIRVHALAKLLGVTSKQVLAALNELGAETRSAQSSLTRDVAESVRDALNPPAPAAAQETSVPPEPVEAEAAQPEPVQSAPKQQLFTSATVAETAEPEPSTESAGPVQAPLFLQPDAEAIAEARRRQKSERAQQDAEKQEQETAPSASDSDDAAAESEDTDTDKGEDSQPRRRRRGRRGRGRGRGEQANSDSDQDDSAGDSDDESGAKRDTAEGTNEKSDKKKDKKSDSQADTKTDDDAAADGSKDESGSDSSQDTGGEEGESGNRRRRRRRRRKVTGDSAGEGSGNEDDPPNTVVHEREPRNKNRGKDKDEVQGISGSTRLEAKRQRRRDGRDAGRRRPPILTESEFLARRESVDRVMVVREKTFPDHPTATQVAVLEDKVLVEHFVTSTSSASMVGNVYLGRVQNVLPSMEAAFVDIGRGRNGVLYAGEVNWEAAGLGGKERKIEQALKPGDQVLVQVSKDPVGHKGARLTTQISLAGRFLVYVPGGTSTGISRKLPDTERKRLKDILREIVPSDAGVIIRTASEGVSEAELARDVERLQNQWHTIEQSAADSKGKGNPLTLYEEPDLLVKVVRDLFNEDFAKLVIEGDTAWNTVEKYIKTVAPDLQARLHRHEHGTGPDVFETYRIDEQLAKALDRKVWLPSGGTLVIDRTEAMTVVDVNTGKFTGAGGNLEETVTRNNLEAAEEIVRQMRLRDIGGMIVVDFIDMVLESNRDLVLRRLTEALGRDRTRHQVSEVTSLGLVQMTRKKLGTGLVEAFSTTCEHCHGRGIVVHSYPVEVSSSDEGGRSGSRGESGGRKRRGRDKQPQAESTEHATPDVDSSVKRAHPVALAMAAHHASEEVNAADGESETDVIAVAAKSTQPEQAEPKQAEPENVVALNTEPAAAPVAEPAAEAMEQTEDETPAESAEVGEAEPPKKRSWLRRRVSRSASAPAGGGSEGTVFVIPADDEATPSPVAAALTESSVQAPPRAPRRRRAAGRPAGPPVDVPN